MDFDALRFARFGQLDDTVKEWSTAVRNLEELNKDAQDGLRGKAIKANWAGINANVTREFVGKTASEFGDALKQAKTLRDIISDTRDELKESHRKLVEAIERGLKKNLTVVATGDGGFTVSMNVHPDRAGAESKLPDHSEADVTAFRDEIQRILNKATEVDSSAARVLKALADQTDYGFSGASYKDRESAAGALKKAEELAALAKQDPGDLSAKEFDILNAGLKRYSGDELFSQRFAEKLGAKNTLDFWADLNVLPQNPDLRSRVDQYDELQKNLGMTLATATHSDSRGMVEWKRDTIDLGGQLVGKGSGAVGFQVMSNLMRWGNYDDEFLKSYGSELIKTEKARSDNGSNAAVAWQQAGAGSYLNRTGSDTGSDPMTGFMKALSNSPEAATDFFSKDFVTTDEDHNFTEERNGKEVKRGLSNFDYLFEERDWPADANSKGEKSNAGKNAMALALEAATTGHAAGQHPTAETPQHNADQAKLVESLVASISDDPTRLTDHSYMSDSIGQITAEYLPDINRATADADSGNESVAKLFPIDGEAAEMKRSDVTRFLVTLGQSPEGYAAVEVGQKAYMANLIDYHMSPDLPDEKRYPHPAEDTIREIARRSGEVGGSLAIGRQESVLGTEAEKMEDYEHSMNQRKNFSSGAIATAVGVSTSFVASPLAGAVIGGATGTVSSLVLEQLFKQPEPDVQDAGQDAAVLWEATEVQNSTLSRIAAESVAAKYEAPWADQAEEWTRQGTRDGFNDAAIAGHRMAGDLESEVPPGS
ncbi:hypothetical protein RCO28_30865 [Streptomyces sp. LHD-70]|uniref:DUF6571 family protein n=1 Tax=Streptomyces sp. LHD-70 TaxID=3072140 RepID=UPI00280CA347|nr:DUF6571 family protein [Streptomyces sp. LHD-70]MDQ8706839.1 hypothetical protein [Streptomyces sp. LHD-70]